MPCEKFVCIAIYQEFSENMYKKKCHDINSLVKNLYTVKASGSGESFEQTTITTERGLSPVNEDHLKRKLA